MVLLPLSAAENDVHLNGLPKPETSIVYLEDQFSSWNIDASKWRIAHEAYLSYDCGGHTSGQAVKFDGGEPMDYRIDNPYAMGLGGDNPINYRGGSAADALGVGPHSADFRQLVTRPLDVRLGGQISFYVFTPEYGASAPCEYPDDEPEWLDLDYSVDQGVSWFNIGSYGNHIGPHSHVTGFKHVVETIPTPAQASNTMFRWRMPGHSGAGYDNLALDDVWIGWRMPQQCCIDVWTPDVPEVPDPREIPVPEVPVPDAPDLPDWPDLGLPRASPPLSGVSAMDLGGQAEMCTVKQAEVWCAESQAGFPEGAVDVSASSTHVCALMADATVHCSGPTGMVSDLDGDAVQVSAGDNYYCILRSNGNVDCEGSWNSSGGFYPDDHDYLGHDVSRISAGKGILCFLFDSGNVQCMGRTDGTSVASYNGGRAVDIAAGDYEWCLVEDTGESRCWYTIYTYNHGSIGVDDAVRIAVEPTKRFCVIRAEGNAVCRGAYEGFSYYNRGDAVAISTNQGKTCVLTTDQRVDCSFSPNPPG